MPSPERSGYNDEQLCFDALWAEPEPARDEQVRPHGDPPLADSSCRTDSRRSRRTSGKRSSRTWGSRRQRRSRSCRFSWRDRTRSGEGYLEKVGRLNAARMQAEEKVLPELILPAPEDPEEEDDSLPAEDRAVVYEDLRADHGGRRRVAFAPAAGEQLAPSGERARVEANLAALRLVARPRARRTRAGGRAEQRTLAAWSGWGAVPGVFDEDRDEWATGARELRELLGEDGYAAARRTTINAHYTDPAIVAAIWQLVQRARVRRRPGARARLRRSACSSASRPPTPS